MRREPRNSRRAAPRLAAALALVLVAGCSDAPAPAPTAAHLEHRRAAAPRLPPAWAERLATLEQQLREDPASRAVRIELAQLYHANRYFPEAEALYASVAGGLDQPDPRLSYWRADVARQQGELGAAERHLQATVRDAPTYVPARHTLAEVRYKLGRADQARAEFEAVLAAQPEHAHAGLALARDDLRRGDRAAARHRLEVLADQHPQFTEGLFLLAQLLESDGRTEAAASLRERGRAGWDLPPDDPWLDELRPLSYDPQQWSIWFEDLLRVGRAAEGLPYLDRIEELDPASPYPDLQRAAYWLGRQAHEQAEASFRRAAAKGAEPSVVYPEWVKTLVELGRFDEAERVARAGLALAPNVPLLHTTLGGVRLREGSFAAAVEHFDRALALDPHHALTHQLMANAYLARGDTAAADRHLEALARIDSRDATARRLLAQHRLEAGDHAAARGRLEEVLRITPDDEEVALLLARIHVAQAEGAHRAGRSDEALRSIQAALQLQPDLVEGLQLQVPLLVDQRRFAEAEAVLARLLTADPQNPRYRVALGNVQRASGRPAAAIATWEEALAQLTAADEVQLRPVLERLIRETPAPQR